ncbi:Signal transduction histidine kinase [Nocardia amikacinitolerans]|uniref:sensor histidine kinase n=1 Tax=Nocardia amikacinitolerans TaxID=756689 RepID=UPI0008302131|nr:histidine kinase [Nocardia amikacinitolerans]MCP2317089.1 Signal transduction histidine kinase [Nocardia amikacinitolerans]
MDVTQAIPPPAGAGKAVPFRERGRVRDRLAAFARDPIGTFRRSLTELPFDYPPKVIVIADIATFVIGVAATVQRHAYFPTAVPLLAMLLLFISVPAFCLFGVVPNPGTLGLCGMGAAALFLLQPVAADFAPFVLVIVVGEVAAIASVRVGAAVAVGAIAELVAFDIAGNVWWSADTERFDGLPMYGMGIVLGFMCGLMLQYQRRFLYRERHYQEMRAAQAAEEERRRIAREVHDVIAHSLSITLLHLTAARHALETDRDVDEAVEALVDAERLGRQAMADIRRTVGLLDKRPSRLAPEPSVRDIEDLVGDFVRAGLDVRYRCTDDLSPVTAAVGLALYRIGQESLANVVKHAPGATATVLLTVDEAAAALTVVNTLPDGLPAQRGHGMGLTGMWQRAELLGGRLTAGPAEDGWSVRAEFPLVASKAWLHCPLPGLFLDATTAVREGATRREQSPSLGAPAWRTLREGA